MPPNVSATMPSPGVSRRVPSGAGQPASRTRCLWCSAPRSCVPVGRCGSAEPSGSPCLDWLPLAPATGQFRKRAAPLGSHSAHPTPGLPVFHWLADPTFLPSPAHRGPLRSSSSHGGLHPPSPSLRMDGRSSVGARRTGPSWYHKAPWEHAMGVYSIRPTTSSLARYCPDVNTAYKRGGARLSRDLGATRSKTEPMARLPPARGDGDDVRLAYVDTHSTTQARQSSQECCGPCTSSRLLSFSEHDWAGFTSKQPQSTGAPGEDDLLFLLLLFRSFPAFAFSCGCPGLGPMSCGMG
ncbi:hypothetical protein B0T14DRAFT_92568 [Immersiella caudata]|uniref:Uncharacterized protein n=1 Tax=Immersiella caudata TaxID=314043 RepID=A0AA39X3B7_9PEZI|nr:hypothetical protein B0T14DRAFT_92568 [Immersiella caudata]